MLPRISVWWLAAALGTFVAAAIAIDYQTRDVPHVLTLAPVAAVSIAVGALCKPATGVVGRTLHFLGDASYSIYLTHSMFISAVLGFISHRMHSAPPLLWVCSITLGAIVWGSVLHVFVERPLLKLGRRLTSRANSNDEAAMRMAA
jgi:peptidoglycan/LPS O-acetylase OafA/YrhL